MPKNSICWSYLAWIMPLIAVPSLASADTFVCIPEAAATVSNQGPREFKGSEALVTDDKYVHTNESGTWVVKILGEDDVYLECESKGQCGNDLAFGIFERTGAGWFQYVFALYNPDTLQTIVMVEKGPCSKL